VIEVAGRSGRSWKRGGSRDLMSRDAAVETPRSVPEWLFIRRGILHPDKSVDEQVVSERTRRWISSMVIGLNLCPFAQRAFEADTIRYAVSDAKDERALLEELRAELLHLASCQTSDAETTLLIHPRVLTDFLDYNDFLDAGERLVGELGLRGTVQLASFHPDYRFAGADPHAVENYTNRSPYPMLHLLREASISRVATDMNELREIPRRNVETLRALGRERILDRLRALQDGPDGRP
jgi:hypothetical protein